MVRNSPPPVSIIAAGAHTIATGLASAANRARSSDAAAAELSQMTRYSCPYPAECPPEFVKLLRHVVQDQQCWLGHCRPPYLGPGRASPGSRALPRGALHLTMTTNCVDPPTLLMARSALEARTARGWPEDNRP
jgi:hypothetical protein